MATYIIDGAEIQVDDEDAHLLTAHRWLFQKSGRKSYVRRHQKSDGRTKTTYLHRAITGDPPSGQVVDHINGDTRDNRRCNLRFVSVTENCQNIRVAKVDSRSGVLGVNWHKKMKKWRVQIRVNRATVHVGYFTDINEASAAYIAKKRELHSSCSI